jgi:hypothetical protein
LAIMGNFSKFGADDQARDPDLKALLDVADTSIDPKLRKTNYRKGNRARDGSGPLAPVHAFLHPALLPRSLERARDSLPLAARGAALIDRRVLALGVTPPFGFGALELPPLRTVDRFASLARFFLDLAGFGEFLRGPIILPRRRPAALALVGLLAS